MNAKQLLTELGIPFVEGGQSHHVTQGWVGIDCPRCSPNSSKFKAGIPSGSRHPVLVCWTCGKLPLARTLADLSQKPLGSILKSLDGWVGVLPDSDQIVDSTRSYSPPQGLKPLSSLPLHRKYLTGRGFDLDYLAKIWKVDQGTALSSKLPWRVFLPVLDARGKPASWTTRALSDDVDRRYINASPEQELVPIKSLLYGGQHLRHVAVAVEGPTDAWRVGPGAVALLGVSFTKAQILKLSKFPCRIVAFDREGPAQEAAERLCDALGPFPGQTLRIELSAADPGSATEKEIRKLRRRYLGGLT